MPPATAPRHSTAKTTVANSPYADALARHMGEQGLEISLLFRKVRDDVLTKTGQAAGALHLRLPARPAVLLPALGAAARFALPDA